MSNHEGVSSDGATDTGPYYDAFVLPTEGQAGGVPSGTESYFSFEYANAHFVCLNTYAVDLSPEAPMARWLVADLAAAKSAGRADWIIAYWHHSPYTKGSHDSDTEAGLIDVRAKIMPLLEAGGVDLIFNGHSHVYERSMLMDGAYVTPTSCERCILDDGDGDPLGDGPYRKSSGLQPHEGTVVVVVGCGGTPVARRGTMPVMRRVLAENGSVLVDVDGDTLTGVMVNAAGEVRDRFQIVKRGRVASRVRERPFQLPAFVDYARHAARLRLEQTPVDGSTRAELLIPPLPAGAGIARAATLSWHCAGTDWHAEPERLQIELPPGEVVQRTVQVACAARPFPLPEVRLTYHTDAGDRNGRLDLQLPPFRALRLVRLAEAPRIDGTLDERERAPLDWQVGLTEYHGSGPARVPTEFGAGLYENALYVCVISFEPEMAHLRIRDPLAPTAHGSDDCAEVFVQLEGEEAYYQFLLNARGQRLDAKSGWNARALAWSGKWHGAVGCLADRWIAEFLIDLGMLSRPLAAGDVLRLNVGRNSAVHGEYSQWSYTNRASSHVPQCFGTARVV